MKKLDLIGLTDDHIVLLETMYKILNRNRDLELLNKLQEKEINHLQNGTKPKKKEEIAKPVFQFNIN